MNNNYKLRYEVKSSDLMDVAEIIKSSGFFRDDEIDVAVELVKERLDKGAESGYEFVFIEIEGKTIGYSCFGLIPCSLISWDLYWIATHNNFRGKGLGKIVLTETENRVRKAGGKAIYIETSSKEKYLPTQKFYENNNCELKICFDDFYDIGDGKLVYVKKL